MKFSRRSFLTSLGGVVAGAATFQGIGRSLEDTANLLNEWSEHQEQWHVSICQQCPAGCGILARVVDGDLKRILGNPLYPVNRGGICMKGLAGTQVVYDPDRIRTPLEREGNRGAGQWKPITWEAALEKIGRRLRSLRENGKSHTVAMLGGQYKGITDQLFDRFWTAYGTPNYLRYRCMEQEKASPTAHYMHGVNGPLCYDLENSRYILSFGCNLLESWISTVHQLRAYGQLRQGQNGERAQVVQVDTRYSVTAAKADQWIPVNPATDAALALGLAHIIIQESLYDRDYVQDKTFGFEDWEDSSGVHHIGFRPMVLEEYPPKRVSEITGVPVETLFRIARSFATTRPALAIGEKGPPFHPNDLYTRMAIHSLNVLVGSIGVKGGVYRQGYLPLSPWEGFRPDEFAREGLSHARIDRTAGASSLFRYHDIQHLPLNIARGKPYELDTLFLYFTNPLYSIPDRKAWLAALDHIPYVVSFSPFMDETTLHADLVLPDCTYLERWRSDEVTYLAGITLFGLGEPVIAPVYDTRQTEDVMLHLARSLGAHVASVLPWENYQAVLYDKARGLFESGRGHIVMPQREEAFEEILLRQGFWRRKFDSYEDFWQELLRKGAWWDPNDSYVGPRQLFKTPSAKFEFYSQTLRQELLQAAQEFAGPQVTAEENRINRLAADLQFHARGDLLFLPHYEAIEPDAGSRDYPFILNSYKLMSHAGGRGANQPLLQQQPAVHLEGGWESWVEINPEVAAQYGIGDEDWVWLESSKGRIQVKARIYPGAMPNVLNMPFGQGHQAYGRWAQNRGQNPNDIITSTFDPVRKLPIWGVTRVRLAKA